VSKSLKYIFLSFFISQLFWWREGAAQAAQAIAPSLLGNKSFFSKKEKYFRRFK